jgi:hypothetical protein
MRRFLLSVLGCSVAVGVVASPAAACGGLVAPNGAVRLAQTSTLAAYHDGVEHYVTSFVYQGAQGSFGSIIPLPGVPTDVRRAGSWTLQRLERETHPVPDAPRFAAASAASAPAQVLLHTTVDALDITVLSGGGPAVLDWVKAHGFAVSPDAPAMLDYYAHRSPVFLAARFDASSATARGQLVGDGTPVQISIPTPNPWVPLHILSLGKPATDVVQADVYLLTDRAPSLLGLDQGVQLQASEPASTTLLADLRSDKDSGWIPDQAWLTFLRVDTPAARLGHDLAIDATGAGRPSAVQAGYNPLSSAPPALTAGFAPVAASPADSDRWVATAVMAIAVVAAAGVALAVRARSRATHPA